MNQQRNLLDIEILVKCIIRGAASKAELGEYYDDDPLRCAKELADSEQGLCGTIDCKAFEIVEAKIKSR